MLQNIRNASQSWLIRGLFAVLIVCFIVLWGVGDVFRPGTSMRDKVVATIGSHKISQLDLEKAFRRDVLQLQLATGKEIDPEQARKKGVMAETFRRLITNTLLDLEADHLGLAISDAQIRHFLHNSPVFHDKSGAFDKNRYTRMLEILHMSEKEYLQQLRSDLRREQLVKGLIAGVQIPIAMARPLYEWQYEKRSVDIALIKPEERREIAKPTEGDLKSYYENHKANFESHENRDLTAVILSRHDIEKNLVLTDEEIAVGFEERQNELKIRLPNRQEDERILNEIKREKASTLILGLMNKIEDTLAEGATLEELAGKFNLNILKLQKVARSGLVEAPLKNNTLSENVLEAIRKEGFANEVGVDPLLTDIGDGTYILVRTDHINPKFIKPFDEVQAQVASAWHHEKQLIAAQELAETLQKEVNEGKLLGEVAAKHKLKTSLNITLSRIKESEDNSEVPAGLRKKIFNSKLKEAVSGRAENGYFVVQLQKILPVDVDLSSKEFKEFSQHIHTLLTNDILEQYLFALEKKYKVDVNNRVLSAEEK